MQNHRLYFTQHLPWDWGQLLSFFEPQFSDLQDGEKDLPSGGCAGMKTEQEGLVCRGAQDARVASSLTSPDCLVPPGSPLPRPAPAFTLG